MSGGGAHGGARRYRLLIFDWDGTLCDSIASIVGCTQATMRELGRPPLDEKLIRSGIGLGVRDAVERLWPGLGEETFARIREVYRRLWLGTWSLRPQLFPGVERTLAALAAAGHVMAVATAKGRQGLDGEMERIGVARYFSTTRTLTESPSKPEPGMVLEIQEETGIGREETLVIGDSVYDVAMAVNAGTDVIGVATGTGRCETLIEAGALDCLASVNDLPAWLDRG